MVLIVSLSGGVDSMVLVHILLALRARHGHAYGAACARATARPNALLLRRSGARCHRARARSHAPSRRRATVSYTHLRAHETLMNL
eukprot:1816454-Prymnesium_polylepis.1